MATKKQPELTEAQRQAKLEAYTALKQADLPIPPQLKEVEGWIADIQQQRAEETERLETEAQTQEAAMVEANANGPWYVRNGYTAPFNFRLDRQTEKRRIELKPRGTPGDLHPLEDDDLKDPILRRNIQLGLLEVIPNGEAQLIIDRQTTNLAHRVHTPLAMLRNELGEAYEAGSFKVEAEFNQQGVTVAQLDPRIMQGQLTDKEIAKGRTAIQRVHPGQSEQPAEVRSAFVPTGGNAASIQYGPLAHQKAVDDLARRRGLQGPAAGLGDVRVTVDPVVRT